MRTPTFVNNNYQQFAVGTATPDKTTVQLTPHDRRQDVESVMFASTSAALTLDQRALQGKSLTTFQCNSSGLGCICWTVDAKKLRSNDRSAVSPLFKLSGMPFKMTINPKVPKEGRAGSSFRAADGKGAVQLKCEASEPSLASVPMTFWISAGSGHGYDALQAPRGPALQNFSKSGVQSLSKGEDIWDFKALQDQPSSTFVVCLAVESPWHLGIDTPSPFTG